MDDRSGADGARPRLGVLLAVIVSTAAITHARAEKLAIAGLRQPVEIVRDRWGIAHIYAQSEHDLFLAQGYNAASDRLFQLELWRRRATGTLAEIQGPRALAADIGARQLALPRRHGRGAGPLSSPRRRDRRGLRPGDQRLHRADRTRAGAAAGRVPHPGDQARAMDPRDRRLAAQRAVSQRHPGAGLRPARPPPGRGARAGAAQPAPRRSRRSSPTGRSTCRSSPTR